MFAGDYDHGLWLLVSLPGITTMVSGSLSFFRALGLWFQAHCKFTGDYDHGFWPLLGLPVISTMVSGYL
jgi:hypothetical protein